MKGEQTVLAHYHDYPDAESGSFKRLRPEQPPKEEPRSTKVLEIKKQVAQQERNRVREQEQLKKIKDNQEAQRALRQQIQNKRRQIEQLEIQRRLAEEEQVRSYELAKFKEQEDRDRQIKKQEQKKHQERAAKQRADLAGKRLIAEKELAEAKQRQAAYRRKVIQDTERQNRNKATKWQQNVNANKPVQEQPLEFNRFYKPLGRVNYNRNVDYTQTCLHNPILVRHQSSQQDDDQPQQTAIDKAREVEQQVKKMRQQRQLSEEQLRQRSKERGLEALRRLQDEKIQEQVSRQAQEKMREYNLRKVEEGKKDQYLGLKPGTLAQMELNKKIRSEKQFQQMFFKDKKLHWVSEPATKYQIADNRSNLQMKSSMSSKSGSSAKDLQKTSAGGTRKQRIQQKQSVIPNQSNSKYSFNDDNILDDEDMIQTKPKNIEEYVEARSPISDQDHSSGKHLEKSRQPFERPERFPDNYKDDKNRETQQTKKSGKQQKQEDNEEERKQEREKIREFIKQNEQYLKNAEKQRRVVFKGTENTRQGENLQGSPNYMDSLLKSAQSKNKAQLSNVCQHKDHSDLDYSQDSEHHEQQ